MFVRTEGERRSLGAIRWADADRSRYFPTDEVNMTRMLSAVLLAATLSAELSAQGASRGPLEGAWKVAEIVVTGADESNTANPQPGLFVFTRRHYSAMWVPGNQPRTLFKAADPANEEKISAFDSFVGNTGTYELAGTTLTIRPMVARYPNCMNGAFMTYQFRVDSNTLTLTQKSTEVNCLIGQRAVPYAGPASETRWKLTRVE